MQKLARISYNSAEWQRPTGDAKKTEVADTYNRQYGFGHEDWLFRNDWLIDGWRYAFIQGVNKSREKLLKMAKPFDLTLFTIQPDKRRRFVAHIRAVECLDDQQAEDAVNEFRRRGWHKTMQDEVRSVGGDPNALGATRFAKHILNVRFRLDRVTRYSPATFAVKGSGIFKLGRYQLFDRRYIASAAASARRRKTGSASLPNAQPFRRKGAAPVECTPEHARMQARLMQELKGEYPKAKIRREEDFVDVSVRTDSELLLFEIKSDQEARAVIRRALGQILEYAFHPTRQHSLPVKLIIVGQNALPTDDREYLERLRADFDLPIGYRRVARSE